MKAELFGAAENFRYFASAVVDDRRPLESDRRLARSCYSLKEPVGVAGQIVPWNYPLLMTSVELLSGARSRLLWVCEPDAKTPLSARCGCRGAGRRGRFPAGAINVVPATGRARALVTSSAIAGRGQGVRLHGLDGHRERDHAPRGADAEADHLELGGKSPNLIFADADLADAVPSSVWAISLRAGQSCEARRACSSRSAIYDDVVSAFAEQGGGREDGRSARRGDADGLAAISPEHRDRVHGFVEQGREQGAEVVLGGEPCRGCGRRDADAMTLRTARRRSRAVAETRRPWSQDRAADQVGCTMRHNHAVARRPGHARSAGTMPSVFGRELGPSAARSRASSRRRASISARARGRRIRSGS